MSRTLVLAIVLFTAVMSIRSTAAQGVPMSEESAVSGDAAFAAAPDFVTITVRSQQTSATAAEATSSLSAKGAKLLAALTAVDPNTKLRLRGEKYLPSTPGPLAIKSGAPVTVERIFAIESGDIEKAGKLIDTALASGASLITDVAFSARNGEIPVQSAIELASKRAREKAELAAKTLGVKLGALLSSVVTEEPEGEALRQQLQTGQPVAEFGERVQHVYVSVRYSVSPAK